MTQVEASRLGDDIDDDDDDDAQPRGGSPEQLPFGLLGSLPPSLSLSLFVSLLFYMLFSMRAAVEGIAVALFS